MDRTLLVQRLEAPAGDRDIFDDNPYVNSGGVANWGISDEFMKLLKGAIQLDYMGAAEFEWGAIQKGLKKIADYALMGELVGTYISIRLDEVQRTFFDQDNEPPEGIATVWIICREEDLAEVERRIRAWAANDHDRYGAHDPDPQWWLCESTYLNAALRPNPSWPTKICGWLELDNGFFFFTNGDMFLNIRKLFGVKEIE
jgi:hypothetical protein